MELIGSVPIDSLTPLSLTAILTELRKRKTGSRQLQQIYTVLRVCLGSAVRLGLLSDNPLLKVDKPKHQTVKREYWDVAETKRFIGMA